MNQKLRKGQLGRVDMKTAARKRTAQRKEDKEKKRKILEHQFQTAKCSSEAEGVDSQARAFSEYEVTKKLHVDNNGQNSYFYDNLAIVSSRYRVGIQPTVAIANAVLKT